MERPQRGRRELEEDWGSGCWERKASGLLGDKPDGEGDNKTLKEGFTRCVDQMVQVAKLTAQTIVQTCSGGSRQPSLSWENNMLQLKKMAEFYVVEILKHTEGRSAKKQLSIWIARTAEDLLNFLKGEFILDGMKHLVPAINLKIPGVKKMMLNASSLTDAAEAWDSELTKMQEGELLLAGQQRVAEHSIRHLAGAVAAAVAARSVDSMY
eukprot:gene26377-17470_t